ncbi:23S rRNA (adenine(1618)-N(6))-methyltransferase RlmF [Halobacteriovorax sp. XZX-3]|uniref:23S rRNA (adenine(1618)-N(6))-methyltransferase RlmF n=1 Tax=unclassified Halobacteriovorax TaxID=2639665 RepID=UPI000CD0F324|nr:23S rRNA (adenine(1618)-N(6))-methyltransferase RlmF [Halobacteriovorax sp. DA5]POB13544.1 23S rRNA (adenine(1618)-N(6))-methyltransferase RlmF [Halobacteriovorax sp. DA5]
MKTDNKELHPRNLHNKSYDFNALIKSFPTLESYVKANQYGNQSVNFSDAGALLCLNQALLAHYYKVTNWSVPQGNLVPPIPGRVDYIHYIADLLAEDNNGKVPVGPKIKGLDIGTGTSCIYPILGNSIYGWKFVGSDISSEAINHANTILKANSSLKKNIKARFQKSPQHIFKELIKSDEKFDFTMCNPPFYSSQEEADKERAKKLKNLNANKIKKGHNPTAKSNFGGVKNELWCEGGEKAFVTNMIQESVEFKQQCHWFTTLISQKENLVDLNKELKRQGVSDSRVIEMIHGHKIAHILAWKF